MLKKRLKFPRGQGAAGKPTYRLGDDFFKQMDDHWTFAGVETRDLVARLVSDADAEGELAE
jgi:hypothetical protein